MEKGGGDGDVGDCTSGKLGGVSPSGEEGGGDGDNAPSGSDNGGAGKGGSAGVIVGDTSLVQSEHQMDQSRIPNGR